MKIHKFIVYLFGMHSHRGRWERELTGIDFLGYIVKPTHTLVRRRVVNNFKYKKTKLLEEEGNVNTIRYKELVSSYKAHFKHADSFNLIKKMLKTKLD